MTLIAFSFNCVAPVSAQLVAPEFHSLPGVSASPSAVEPLIKGLRLIPDKPFEFDFIVDGQPSSFVESADDASERSTTAATRDELLKLIKYFMASLAIPETDLWVNLNPREPDRIVPESFGRTDMGRDLLSQDYVLKQITASLMSPEGESGRKFWERVYEKIYEQNIPSPLWGGQGRGNNSTEHPHPASPIEGEESSVDDLIESFNKVWIVPDQIEVFEQGDRVFITRASLKVMLEEDYLSSGKVVGDRVVEKIQNNHPSTLALYHSTTYVKDIIRNTILPLIEDEVNHGSSFAPLRQIYHSLILATWYKRKLKDSVLNRIYSDRQKIDGINLQDTEQARKIYDQYLAAFNAGVSDVIHEEYDPQTQTVVPRRYFTGGANLTLNRQWSHAQSVPVMDKASLAIVHAGFENVHQETGRFNRAQLSIVRRLLTTILGWFKTAPVAHWDDFSDEQKDLLSQTWGRALELSTEQAQDINQLILQEMQAIYLKVDLDEYTSGATRDGLRVYDEMIVARGLHWRHVFKRVGSVYFMEPRIYLMLSESVRKLLGTNVALYPGFFDRDDTDLQAFERYNTALMFLMRSVNVRQYVATDFGSGDGILSLYAHKMGAGFLNLLDYSETKLKDAVNTFSFNGLLPDDDFKTYKVDLTISEDVRRILDDIDRALKDGQSIAALVNIGSWSQYRVDNWTVIDALREHPRVGLLLAGGYDQEREGSPEEAVVRRDQNLAKSFGFKIFDQIKPYRSTGTIMAWAAKRDPAMLDSSPQDDIRERIHRIIDGIVANDHKRKYLSHYVESLMPVVERVLLSAPDSISADSTDLAFNGPLAQQEQKRSLRLTSSELSRTFAMWKGSDGALMRTVYSDGKIEVKIWSQERKSDAFKIDLEVEPAGVWGGDVMIGHFSKEFQDQQAQILQRDYQDAFPQFDRQLWEDVASIVVRYWFQHTLLPFLKEKGFRKAKMRLIGERGKLFAQQMGFNVTSPMVADYQLNESPSDEAMMGSALDARIYNLSWGKAVRRDLSWVSDVRKMVERDLLGEGIAKDIHYLHSAKDEYEIVEEQASYELAVRSNYLLGYSRIYIRIGDIFIMDPYVYTKLSFETRHFLGTNVIVYPGLFEGFSDLLRFQMYTLAAMFLAARADFNNVGAFDFGSGDGILSVYLYKMGAETVDLFDHSKVSLLEAEKVLEMNGLVLGENAWMHPIDLRHQNVVEEEIRQIILRGSLEKTFLTVMNIGQWYAFDNLNIIGLLGRTSSVKEVIFSAYDQQDASIDTIVARDQAVARESGFLIKDVALYGSQKQAIAWSAQRADRAMMKEDDRSDQERLDHWWRLMNAYDQSRINQVYRPTVYNWTPIQERLGQIQESWGKSRNLSSVEIESLTREVADNLRDNLITWNSQNSTQIGFFFSIDNQRMSRVEGLNQSGFYDFVRIGPVFFFDAQAYLSLSEDLRERLGPNAAIIPFMKSSHLTRFPGFREGVEIYNSSTMFLMQHENIGHDPEIEAGAGEGILSLLAMKMGSPMSFLIEKENQPISQSELTLLLNGYVPEKDFFIYQTDLTQRKEVEETARQILQHLHDKEVVIVGNIGVWPKLYPGMNNSYVVDLLEFLPNTRLLIMGGYDIQNRMMNRQFTANDFRKLGDYKFYLQSEIKVALGESVLAFSASRNNSAMMSRLLSPSDIKAILLDIIKTRLAKTTLLSEPAFLGQNTPEIVRIAGELLGRFPSEVPIIGVPSRTFSDDDIREMWAPFLWPGSRVRVIRDNAKGYTVQISVGKRLLMKVNLEKNFLDEEGVWAVGLDEISTQDKASILQTIYPDVDISTLRAVVAVLVRYWFRESLAQVLQRHRASAIRMPTAYDLNGVEGLIWKELDAEVVDRGVRFFPDKLLAMNTAAILRKKLIVLENDESDIRTFSEWLADPSVALTLSVGAGEAKDLWQLAREHPDQRFVGIDLYIPIENEPRYTAAAQKFSNRQLDAQRDPLPNLTLLRMNAADLDLLPRQSLDRILILRPNIKLIQTIGYQIDAGVFDRVLKPGGQLTLYPYYGDFENFYRYVVAGRDFQVDPDSEFLGVDVVTFSDYHRAAWNQRWFLGENLKWVYSPNQTSSSLSRVGLTREGFIQSRQANVDASRLEHYLRAGFLKNAVAPWRLAEGVVVSSENDNFVRDDHASQLGKKYRIRLIDEERDDLIFRWEISQEEPGQESRVIATWSFVAKRDVLKPLGDELVEILGRDLDIKDASYSPEQLWKIMRTFFDQVPSDVWTWSSDLTVHARKTNNDEAMLRTEERDEHQVILDIIEPMARLNWDEKKNNADYKEKIAAAVSHVLDSVSRDMKVSSAFALQDQPASDENPSLQFSEEEIRELLLPWAIPGFEIGLKDYAPEGIALNVYDPDYLKDFPTEVAGSVPEGGGNYFAFTLARHAQDVWSVYVMHVEVPMPRQWPILQKKFGLNKEIVADVNSVLIRYWFRVKLFERLRQRGFKKFEVILKTGASGRNLFEKEFGGRYDQSLNKVTIDLDQAMLRSNPRTFDELVEAYGLTENDIGMIKRMWSRNPSEESAEVVLSRFDVFLNQTYDLRVSYWFDPFYEVKERIQDMALGQMIRLQQGDSESPGFSFDYKDQSFVRENGYTSDHQYVYVRIKDTMFVDLKRFLKLPREKVEALSAALGSHIILVPDLNKSPLVDRNFASHGKDGAEKFRQFHYNTATLLGMSVKQMNLFHVVDSGAGEGVLSVFAAKQGSPMVSLVDRSPQFLQQAREMLILNGYEEDRDFSIHQGDLTNPQDVLRVSDEIGKINMRIQRPVAVVSNIGQWPEAYGEVSNQNSMAFLRFLPNVTLLIAAGYNLEEDRHQWFVDNDERFLRKEYPDFQVDSDAVTVQVGSGRVGVAVWSASRSQSVNPAMMSGGAGVVRSGLESLIDLRIKRTGNERLQEYRGQVLHAVEAVLDKAYKQSQKAAVFYNSNHVEVPEDIQNLSIRMTNVEIQTLAALWLEPRGYIGLPNRRNSKTDFFMLVYDRDGKIVFDLPLHYSPHMKDAFRLGHIDPQYVEAEAKFFAKRYQQELAMVPEDLASHVMGLARAYCIKKVLADMMKARGFQRVVMNIAARGDDHKRKARAYLIEELGFQGEVGEKVVNIVHANLDDLRADLPGPAMMSSLDLPKILNGIVDRMLEFSQPQDKEILQRRRNDVVLQAQRVIEEALRRKDDFPKDRNWFKVAPRSVERTLRLTEQDIRDLLFPWFVDDARMFVGDNTSDLFSARVIAAPENQSYFLTQLSRRFRDADLPAGEMSLAGVSPDAEVQRRILEERLGIEPQIVAYVLNVLKRYWFRVSLPDVLIRKGFTHMMVEILSDQSAALFFNELNGEKLDETTARFDLRTLSVLNDSAMMSGKVRMLLFINVLIWSFAAYRFLNRGHRVEEMPSSYDPLRAEWVSGSVERSDTVDVVSPESGARIRRMVADLFERNLLTSGQKSTIDSLQKEVLRFLRDKKVGIQTIIKQSVTNSSLEDPNDRGISYTIEVDGDYWLEWMFVIDPEGQVLASERLNRPRQDSMPKYVLPYYREIEMAYVDISHVEESLDQNFKEYLALAQARFINGVHGAKAVGQWKKMKTSLEHEFDEQKLHYLQSLEGVSVTKISWEVRLRISFTPDGQPRILITDVRGNRAIGFEGLSEPSSADSAMMDVSSDEDVIGQFPTRWGNAMVQRLDSKDIISLDMLPEIEKLYRMVYGRDANYVWPRLSVKMQQKSLTVFVVNVPQKPNAQGQSEFQPVGVWIGGLAEDFYDDIGKGLVSQKFFEPNIGQNNVFYMAYGGIIKKKAKAWTGDDNIQTIVETYLRAQGYEFLSYYRDNLSTPFEHRLGEEEIRGNYQGQYIRIPLNRSLGLLKGEMSGHHDAAMMDQIVIPLNAFMQAIQVAALRKMIENVTGLSFELMMGESSEILHSRKDSVPFPVYELASWKGERPSEDRDIDHIIDSVVQLIKEELHVSTGKEELRQRYRNFSKQYLLQEEARYLKNVHVVNLGPLFFIDQDFYEDLKSRGFDQLMAENNILIIPNMSRDGVGVLSGDRFYTLSSLILTMHSQLREKVFVDLGSGGGIQALAALRKGAIKAVLVERESGLNAQARTMLTINGYEEGKDFVILEKDFEKDFDAVVELLKEHLTDQEVYFFANYGITSPDLNQTPVRMVKALEAQGVRVKEVVLGGLSRDDETEERANVDIDQLQEAQFRLLLISVFYFTQALYFNKAMMASDLSKRPVADDASASDKGGIDLTGDKMKIRASGQLDPAMMRLPEGFDLEHFTGFRPVIYSVSPLKSLSQVLDDRDAPPDAHPVAQDSVKPLALYREERSSQKP